jgi:LysR family transcriptional regulator, glycine cleavage system transcriptional activator
MTALVAHDGADPANFEVERGPVFSQMSLAIYTAIAGQGVALARSALVASDLALGRLARPSSAEAVIGPP